MPIRKKADGYYWGGKGPFPTHEKAEQVARAAYANGYRPGKPTRKKSKRKASK